MEQHIALDATPLHFGGYRRWFLCPRCSARVVGVFSAGKYFVCRHCADLAYSSRREDSGLRALRRGNKIIRRLGGDPDDEYYPDNPKHMHWKTDERPIAEAERCHAAFGAYLGKWLAYFERA